MKQLADGDTPLMFCHGGLKQVIPVFVWRLACLTDKVERADCTCALSCTSEHHRCFGVIALLVPPGFDCNGTKHFLDCQSKGKDNLNL